ncbi:hypothetical protein [Flavobacterium sp. UBA4854]|uniref:hypothetical protein n=1 Tax=Flavobacterium sp. UBA4854 TaxID=1946548 RepID=UPI0025803728|nr:hypothetical protein [Flavobacterium sp. UBA4854]
MSNILASGLVNSKNANKDYLGFYKEEKEPEYYYGQIGLTCSTTIFHEYANLIKEYSCDTINLVDGNDDNFRFLYNKIPVKDKICSISIVDQSSNCIDKEWDLSDLSNFENLKSLSIYSLNYLKKIDLSTLAIKLERLIFQYKERNFELNVLNNLKVLKLFDLNEKDCSCFSTLNSLNRIAIINSTIKSLEGLGKIPNLNMLYIDKTRGLSDFSSILKMDSIEHLWFGTGIKNVDWDFLKTMPQLKSLHVDKAKDISFIKDLPNLEFFTASKIEDKNINPITEHKGIRKGVGKPFPFII